MDNKVVFTTYEIKDCLFDIERTLNLKRSINEQVKEGDIVIEAGGGTGILSMFALKAGAKHVYIIELSARFTNQIRKIAKANGFEDRVTVINGDATETDMPVMADVYISELLCTGLFNEPQVQAYNNIRHFMKDDATYIPMGVCSHIAFANADRKVFGVDIACDSYLADDIIHRRLTDFDQYMDIVFNGGRVDTRIYKRGRVAPLSIGVVNSALIVSNAKLSPNIDAGQTKFLFNPELIFIDTPYHGVSEDTIITDYEIEYIAGCDTLDVELRVF